MSMTPINGEELSGIKFESKNKDIVAVDSKTGAITAKKKGNAVVKITWQKQKLYCAIKVGDSGVMKSYQKTYADGISRSKKFVKAYGNKVSGANAAKVLQAMTDINKGDWTPTAVYEYEPDTYKTKYYVYSADVVKAYILQSKASNYFWGICPFATQSSYCFKTSSLSGKGKDITATLSKKVSKEQLIGAQYYYSWYNTFEKVSEKSFSFPMYVMDSKTGDLYSATATIKLDSKEMKIKCEQSLKSGRKYVLCHWEWDDPTDWVHMGKSSFTAK